MDPLHIFSDRNSVKHCKGQEMKQMVEMPTLFKDMFHKNGEHVGKAMSSLILDSDTVCFFLLLGCVCRFMQC